MIAYGMDKTRRRKVQSKDKRKVVALHKTKNLWLSNKEKLKEDQRKMLEELLSSDNNLDTLVAYTYKLKLQDFYSKKRDYSDDCHYLEKLELEMANSSVHEMRKVSESLTKNAVEILNYFIVHKTNGIL